MSTQSLLMAGPELIETDIAGTEDSTFRPSDDELRQFVDDGQISFSAQGISSCWFPAAEGDPGRRQLPAGGAVPAGRDRAQRRGQVDPARGADRHRPATSGSVLYDERDLYADYAELRHRIGLVPQENILHMQLSARRALQYAAELRFPRDTSPAERERRIDEVLEELSLTQHADTRAYPCPVVSRSGSTSHWNC